MIDAAQIVLRMRSTVGAETEKGLAKVLGLGHSTISAWKARNSVPLEYLVRVARDRDVSVDWLVFGIVGERESRGRSYEEATAKVRRFTQAEHSTIAEALREIASVLDGGAGC